MQSKGRVITRLEKWVQSNFSFSMPKNCHHMIRKFCPKNIKFSAINDVGTYLKSEIKENLMFSFEYCFSCWKINKQTEKRVNGNVPRVGAVWAAHRTYWHTYVLIYAIPNQGLWEHFYIVKICFFCHNFFLVQISGPGF